VIRFIYRASAMAVGGRIRKPSDFYIEPQAACVLPSVGGKAAAEARDYRLTDPATGEFILSFSSAKTMIEGSESAPGVHTTLISIIITDLNVSNVLRADQVVTKLSLRYQVAGDRVAIDTTGSGFVNLRINGQSWDVGLDHALGREASDYQAFRRNHPEYPETRGAIHSSLGRHPSLKFDPYEHGYHDKQRFGRIYFAEWSAAPFLQTLTMLRLRLGSPQEGEIGAGGGVGDGEPYP